MIDTNVLRLHGLRTRLVDDSFPFHPESNPYKYSELLRYFLREVKSEIKETKIDIQMPENDRILFNQIREYHSFYRQNKRVTVWATGDVMTSSHYNLGYRLPLGSESDYIEFNFSVPKLIYGTNILQFVPHRQERGGANFSMYKNSDSNYNADLTYYRYMEFIKTFFYRLNGHKHIDLQDLQILRIDICQMQVFQNKEDSLLYLSHQKDIDKKYRRKNSRKPSSFGTTVFHYTDDYGAKIYHKGDEYRGSTGEKSHHLAVNKKYGHWAYHLKDGQKKFDYPKVWINSNIFDVNALQDFADKCLRYEISFRNSMLSKLYRKNIFRAEDINHQKKMLKFKMLERIFQYSDSKITGEEGTIKKEKQIERKNYYMEVWNGERIIEKPILNSYDELLIKNQGYVVYWNEDKKIKYSIVKEKVMYKQKDGTWYHITKEDRDFFYHWQRILDRKLEFYFDVNQATKEMNRGDLVYEDTTTGFDYVPSHAKFSKALLNELFNMFFKFKDEFKISKKTSFTNARNKIEQHNKRIEDFNKKVSHPKIKGLVQDKPISKKRLSRMKLIFALNNDWTFKELQDKGIISKSTRFQWAKEMKDLDLNFRDGSQKKIFSSDNFEWYHNELKNPSLGRHVHSKYFY